MIRIQGLNKFFNKGRQNEIHVINDVSLELPEKGMVAIFGKSGCGKTTLLNVIGGLDSYESGSLTIEGRDVRENTDDTRNKYVGYIFQNYNLHKTRTCAENVADALRLCGMSDEYEIERRVHAALTAVDMEKYGKRTPDTLSGGQQQRIAIARAIVKNPRIILADEPTGNLDEANTVMIMELLKAISRDHLVLLVTHEANLVDYYCDTVIELSDGKVQSVRHNKDADGYAARDKNDIYLGELAKTELADANAEIEYYGDAPASPIKVKIVNSGGKFYVRIDTDKVHLLDGTSEVKLREGVYETAPEKKESGRRIDMSELPRVEGTDFGKLFSFGSSVKSGYTANFRKTKKGKKVLRSCMSLFASVIVFMSAVFGTVFGQLADVKDSYNHNVFYIYTPDADVSGRLNAAVGKEETGIDYVRLSGYYPEGDSYIFFRTGNFETFGQSYYGSNFLTNAVYLDMSLSEGYELVCGERDGLDIQEILITTKVADALLEISNIGYITEYEDLIGLVSNSYKVDGKYMRIAGVVRSDETAVYLSGLAMAKYASETVRLSYAQTASSYGIDVAKGEAILAIKNYAEGVKYPNIGETVKIQGKEFKVADIKVYGRSYTEWLRKEGISKTDERTYFEAKVKEKYPELTDTNSKEFNEAFSKAVNDYYYEYADYYAAEAGDYIRDMTVFDPGNIDAWLYTAKNIPDMKYAFFANDWFKAAKYKELYGKYPTCDELNEAYSTLPDLQETVLTYRDTYNEEFSFVRNYDDFDAAMYLVSDGDFISLFSMMGETHPSADRNYAFNSGAADEFVSSLYSESYYTVIHSSDPELTSKWLSEEFSDLEPDGYGVSIVTPDSIFKAMMTGSAEVITASFIAMGVMLALMSVCMYFIMRSSLMNRIKEVGIYRAIGVSKKNLVFRFFVEALVLASLTVLLGYLATSAFIYVCLSLSPLVSEIFYYPIWFAGVILLILYALSLVCGTLPILSLLRKTPSEILSKYDI